MQAWALLLGGLLVWAAQFFALYGLASIAPGTQIARTGTVIVTVACAAADVLLLIYAARGAGRASDGFDRWLMKLGIAGAALSLVAVLWQGLPALLV